MTLLTDIRDALAKLECLGRPRTEYRIHPDDLEELRRVARTMPTFQSSEPPTIARFGGVLLIPDAEAPRLPRKA